MRVQATYQWADVDELTEVGIADLVFSEEFYTL